MSRKPPGCETGSIVVVTLILLMALALLGVSAMQGALLEEQMIAGQRQQALSMAAAESGLRDAELWLSDPALVVPPAAGYRCQPATATCRARVASGMTRVAGQQVPLWDERSSGPARYRDLDEDWWKTEAVPVSIPPLKAPVSRYIIEQLPATGADGSLVLDPTARQVSRYRITARGTGPGDGPVSIVQVVYNRIF